MKITMAELARKCGFSKATVSRALADDPRVKLETKTYIQKMARRYNYQPHPVASNLARRRTKTIGLLFPKAPRTIADPFFLEYLQGVSETLFEEGYSLFIPQVRPRRDRETLGQLTVPGRVDGIILTEPRLEDERLELLRASGIPFVFLGSTVSQEVSWVDGDNVAGSFQAVQALGRLGHRRIAVISGEEGLVSTRNRLLGYRKALHSLGLEFQPELLWPGDFTRQGGFQAVQRNLKTIAAWGVSAIFASNDLMAIGAWQALKAEGFSVPAEISLIGFDGIEVGQYLSPPLTTVEQPVHQLGQRVSQVLLSLIAGKEQPLQITLPVRLVNLGSTTAPPPGRENLPDGEIKRKPKAKDIV